MKQFTLESTQKNVLFGLMGLGAICLVASYFVDPLGDAGHHLRFWTNLLHNSAFFTGIAFTCTFALAATSIAYAGWHTAFKRVWEGMSLFLPIGLVGIAIVGTAGYFGIHTIYPWMDPSHVKGDAILEGKAGFLNFGFYLLALGFGLVWWFFAYKFRQFSTQQDESGNDTSYPWYKKLKLYAAIFLPIAGFSSAAAIWLWMMSIDPHWYSTMYAWYTTASWWVSAVAITILLLLYLKSKGFYQEVTEEHLHDLGKFLFAFSVFWTYLWFSQYMLIWYANIGEETIYFRQRMGEFPVLYYGNFVMNFVLPFLILIRNDTKRKWGTLAFASILVLVGHWWDFFQMIKVGPYKEVMNHQAAHAAGAHAAAGHGAEAAHQTAEHAVQGAELIASGVVELATPALDALEKTNLENFFHYSSDMTAGYGIPGLLEIGIFLGFGALFVYSVLSKLQGAALVPKNDPYLEETLHHHS